MSAAKAFICGVEGTALSADERAFLICEKPWGLILFKRNIETLAQVAQLIAQFRACVGRSDAPVLIDQEGGRVQRIMPPLLPKYPAAEVMARIYATSPTAARRAVYLHARLIAHDLHPLGINVNCLPLLDLLRPETHGIIGDRALGAEIAAVSDLGMACCEGHLDGGVLPIIKHIPGHGRALVDSHEDLPRVDASADVLKTEDFTPFHALRDQPLAMTAHIVYEAFDAACCATHSARVVENIIRQYIGFSGLLMSDDLSMKALGGSYAERTDKCFAAGCDVALHCNGHMDEMLAVAANSPVLSGISLERAQRALALLHPPKPFDVEAARAEFSQLTGHEFV